MDLASRQMRANSEIRELLLSQTNNQEWTGWKVKVDGKEVNHTAEQGKHEQNKQPIQLAPTAHGVYGKENGCQYVQPNTKEAGKVERKHIFNRCAIEVAKRLAARFRWEYKRRNGK